MLTSEIGIQNVKLEFY